MDRVAYLPIGEQLKVLELAAGIELPLSDPEKSELYEMTLVRNLGLHNRCEVDSRYLDRSPRKGLAIGKVRVIEIDELYSWHRLLLSLVNSSAREVALAFVRAPDYP